ncbi:UTRA domain-containing protein [Variovorax sp. PBL-H6]|uniref:UTRA domain-containing protein n=1 Tax=Variovorax sp. PBL-H6 TaxID=434009 RepID=UPI003FCED9D8
MPERFGAKITAAALKSIPFYELLLAHSMVFGRVIQEVNAEAASPQLAQQLETEVGSPLLRVSRLLRTVRARRGFPDTGKTSQKARLKVTSKETDSPRQRC